MRESICPDIKFRDRVVALKDIRTKNRVMKAGETGYVSTRWPYMIEIIPDGKKLSVGTCDEESIEKLEVNEE